MESDFMKISVFFDLYCPFHENKDPGQILLGLMETGIGAGVVTVIKKDLENYRPKFPLTQSALKEFYNEEFWLKNISDVIIAYPLQGAFYSPLIEKMKLGGKKVLLKFDSDGRIAYPLQRHSFRIPLHERLTLRNLISDLWWRLAFKSLKRRKHEKVATDTVRQIELSDGAIIESPDALSNLNFFLAAWGRRDLIRKTYFIPNPVTPEFVEGEIGKKENIAVSYGRWDDFRQKNTRVMAETVVEFLMERRDYKFLIFGKGTEEVKNLLGEVPENVKERIEILGFVEREKIKGLLTNAKIFFVPSRWESFSIASAEALCMGCSVVGTPLESLRYLSMQGFSGTTAPTFDRKAIFAALLQDAIKWDNGDYEPEKIAAFWRNKLDRKNIAKNVEHLASGK
jgi:glycosyltransferase involved in cell wall biosynthesis